MSQRSFIGRIFNFIGRGIDAVRTFLGRLIFVLIAVVVLGWIFSGPSAIDVPRNSLVLLAPQGAIVEQPSLMSASDLLLGSGEFIDTPLQDILDTLERTQNDERIRGVVLDLNEMSGVSPANLERIGRALDAYKVSGKALIAHGQFYTQAQYYLASYADSVYLHPMGQLMLQGYGGSQLYFSELLEKLGVTMHIFRVGTHKAAVEPYTLMGMSPESRLNNQQLVDELWRRYINQIAQNRTLSVEQVQDYAQDYATFLVAADGDTARVALDNNLVDELVTTSQLRERLNSVVGAQDEPARTISHERYLFATDRIELPGQSEIGVIVAQGTINIGEQPRGVVGADTINKLIVQARLDPAVKALVLRVDSPGGSAFASELIRQELVELQRAGKPVIISMAGTAASGGYWIAATADEIWASPATITGSIGVFSMIPTFEGSLEKLGVFADGVGTTPLSRADVLTGLNGEMETVLQTSVEKQYRNFLELVADGRDLEIDAVDAVAQGQVWTGTQALGFGLVDNLGDLDDAILAAAKLADLEEYTWRYIEKPLSPGEQFAQELINNFSSQASVRAITQSLITPLEQKLYSGFGVSALQNRLSEASQFLNIQDPSDTFAVCEFCVSLPQ
ncbi:MAG: signal peptide peptidase SppA [Gammaproteobacteria bacterium]